MNASLTNYSAAFKECLEQLDVALMRKLWQHTAPNMPQPETDEETLITIHMARTECKVVAPKLRMYSHCWLKERGYPSQLPDHMRASAERMYPKIVRAVGLSVNAKSDLLKPIVEPVRTAMEQAVLEIHADDPSLSDDALIKRHINEAKSRTLKTLLGLKG